MAHDRLCLGLLACLALLLAPVIAMVRTESLQGTVQLTPEQAGQHGRAAAAPAPASPFADRAERLLRQLTLEEKIGQMSSDAPAVIRDREVLIPAFNWWHECLHGMVVGDPGEGGGTIFPQAGFGRRSCVPTSLRLIAALHIIWGFACIAPGRPVLAADWEDMAGRPTAPTFPSQPPSVPPAHDHLARPLPAPTCGRPAAHRPGGHI